MTEGSWCGTVQPSLRLLRSYIEFLRRSNSSATTHPTGKVTTNHEMATRERGHRRGHLLLARRLRFQIVFYNQESSRL